MGKYVISRPTFENIIKGLVRLEENKDIWIERFFPATKPDTANERVEMIALLERYIEHMNYFLQSVDKGITSSRDFPFIIIGCEIEVLEMFKRRRHQLRLVYPLEESVQAGDVSVFSPLGKALLLKETGSMIELDLPAGKIKYQVISIKY